MPEITGPRRCLAVPGDSSSVASHHRTYATDGRGGDSEGSTLDLEGHPNINSTGPVAEIRGNSKNKNFTLPPKRYSNTGQVIVAFF